MAFPTDSWEPGDSVYAKVYNWTHYPTITLQIRETKRKIERRKNKCGDAAKDLITDEKLAFQELRAAHKRGATQQELEHIATNISAIRGRRRLQLNYRNQYQATLQEIEAVEALGDQTKQVKELAAITRRIDASLPVPAARNLVRNYSRTKTAIRTTSEQINEALEDEDTEYDNKVHDAGTLVNMYLDELGLRANEVSVPRGMPQASGSSSAMDARDAEMLAKLNAL